MGKPKIAPGYRVGKLEVVEPTDQRKNGYTVWRCLCGCGGETTLDTRTLQRGTITDCGCETRVPPGAVDLTGKRFGRLIAIEPTDRRGKDGSILWRCLCDCDRVAYIPSRQLIWGYSKSCGCLGNSQISKSN